MEGLMNKRLNRFLILTVSFVFLFLSFSTLLYAEQYSRVVAFGDSLTDHNGLNQYVPTAPEAFTNCQGAPCVWVEYMAAQLGMDVVNNAIGGAMSKGHSDEELQAAIDSGALPPLGLVGQVDTYVSQSPEFDAEETLFAIWIGGNDLLEFLRGESPAETPQALVQGAMANIESAMAALIDAGALNFLVLTIPDLSQSPAFNQMPEENRGDIKSLVEGFNQALTVTVAGVEYQTPDAAVINFDVFELMNGLIGQEVFENVTGTYLELDANGDPTGNVNGDASDFLFYDPIHPTTAAHAIVGDKAAATVDSADTGKDYDDSDTCFIRTASGF